MSFKLKNKNQMKRTFYNLLYPENSALDSFTVRKYNLEPPTPLERLNFQIEIQNRKKLVEWQNTRTKT